MIEHFVQSMTAVFEKNKAELLCEADVPYGQGPNEQLDIWPGNSEEDNSPVFVFVHGGYWQARAKTRRSNLSRRATDNSRPPW